MSNRLDPRLPRLGVIVTIGWALSIGLHSSAHAQTTSARVSLNVMNLSDQLAVVQGDDLQVEITVLSDPQNELRNNDKVLLLRIDDGTIVSQSVRGTLENGVATVVLGTTGQNALGAVRVQYVKQNGTFVPDPFGPILVVADPAILDLSARLDRETADRIAADAALQSGIADEAAARAAADGGEAVARQAADAALQSGIVAEETARATRDATLQAAINAESATREAGDAALHAALNDEAAARASGDESLRSGLDAEVGSRIAADQAEETARQAADFAEAAARRDGDMDEEAARRAADTSLAANLDAEVLAREAADEGLGADLEAEALARQSGDADLQAQLDLKPDVDTDTLADLACAPGQITMWDGASWICADQGERMGRTFFVAASGTPAENCGELRSLLDGLNDWSETNRYVVQLDSGTYDCGDETLFTKPYMTLRGSGIDNTKITGSFNGANGMVHLDRFNELSDLTLVHPGDETLVACVPLQVGQGGRVTNVRAMAGPCGNLSGAIGVACFNGDLTVLRDVIAIADRGSLSSQGIVTGVLPADRSCTIEMVNVFAQSADSPASWAVGVFGEGGSGVSLIVRESRLRSHSIGIVKEFGAASIISSQIIAPQATSGAGPFNCLFSYDGGFAPLGSTTCDMVFP